MGRAAGRHARSAPERREHPDAGSVSPALRCALAGGPLLYPGGILRAGRTGTEHGLYPRPVQPAHPLFLPRVGAGPLGASRAGARSSGDKDSVMAASTKPARKPASPDTAALHRRYLRQMLLIRRFEEKTGEAYSLGKIGGFCHLYIGQEAVAVGSIAALRPDDYITTAYRDHGQALARGMSARAVMAELFGKA